MHLTIEKMHVGSIDVDRYVCHDILYIGRTYKQMEINNEGNRAKDK